MEQLDLFKNLVEEDIFEDITSRRQLKEAFRKVKSNKGSAGIDMQSIEEFEENLEEEIRKLSEELKNWRYKPKAVRRVLIPKANSKEKRKLGIATVRDRVVQQSIKMSIESEIDKGFSRSSYGFRPGRNQHQAIQKAQEYIEAGYEIVVDLDLEKFFDKIPQDRLVTKVSKLINDKRVVKLIGMTLRSGIEEDGVIKRSREGVPQGSPLSPLLSNIVLDELDKELEKRGLRFCRFADDSNIYCKTEKAGERILKSITKFIEKKMKLKVNKDKSKVAPSKQVAFLAMTIIASVGIVISKKAMKKAFEKLRELIPRNSDKSIEKTIEEVNRWLRGWYEYFKLTIFPSQIRKIEAHIRRRLRAKIVRQRKRKRFLIRLLIKMGVKKDTAYKAVYLKQGPWDISWSNGMHQAFSNIWFKNKGLFTPSNNRLSHWLELDKWIALT